MPKPAGGVNQFTWEFRTEQRDRSAKEADKSESSKSAQLCHAARITWAEAFGQRDFAPPKSRNAKMTACRQNLENLQHPFSRLGQVNGSEQVIQVFGDGFRVEHETPSRNLCSEIVLVGFAEFPTAAK